MYVTPFDLASWHLESFYLASFVLNEIAEQYERSQRRVKLQQITLPSPVLQETPVTGLYRVERVYRKKYTNEKKFRRDISVIAEEVTSKYSNATPIGSDLGLEIKLEGGGLKEDIKGNVKIFITPSCVTTEFDENAAMMVALYSSLGPTKNISLPVLTELVRVLTLVGNKLGNRLKKSELSYTK